MCISAKHCLLPTEGSASLISLRTADASAKHCLLPTEGSATALCYTIHYTEYLAHIFVNKCSTYPCMATNVAEGLFFFGEKVFEFPMKLFKVFLSFTLAFKVLHAYYDFGSWKKDLEILMKLSYPVTVDLYTPLIDAKKNRFFHQHLGMFSLFQTFMLCVWIWFKGSDNTKK